MTSTGSSPIDYARIARELAAGEYTAVELAEATLAGAQAEGLRNAFMSLTPERAIAEAEASDARRAAGQTRGPLDGVPVAWKDLFDVKGTVTTAGAEYRRHAEPAAADAPAVAALAAAGMVCVGKTNLSELAFSGLGVNAHFGTPINPFGADRIPGGSSSGAAVAVATGLVTCAIGTDTAGSVRVPAALCGVTGFKTSSSRVDRHGVFALAPSLDTVGVLATDVRGCAAVEAALRSRAPRIPAAQDPRQVRLVVPTGPLTEDVAPDVAERIEAALRLLQDAGVTVERRPVPALDATQELFARRGPLSVAEAGREHAALLDSPDAELLEPIVRQRLTRGRAVSEEDYDALRAARGPLQAELAADLGGDGLLAFATVAQTAPPRAGLEDPDAFVAANARVLRGTIVGSYLDTPGVTLPLGCAADGLPVGLLVSAASNDDDRLLAAAQTIEAVVGAMR